MNWEATAAIGELVAAFGVILTLFYLATQIRQNTRTVRTSTLFNVQEATRQHPSTVVQNERLAEIMVKDIEGADLTPTESLMLGNYLNASIRHLENIFHQYESGLISDEIMHTYDERIRGVTRGNERRDEWWVDRQRLFSESFRLYVDRVNRDQDNE